MSLMGDRGLLFSCRVSDRTRHADPHRLLPKAMTHQVTVTSCLQAEQSPRRERVEDNLSPCHHTWHRPEVSHVRYRPHPKAAGAAHARAASRWKVAHSSTEATTVGAATVLPVVCPPWSLQWPPKTSGCCVRLGGHQSGHTHPLPSPRRHRPRSPAAVRRGERVHGTAATARRRH